MSMEQEDGRLASGLREKEKVLLKEKQKYIARLHMTCIWQSTSAPFTCSPDRLKTLKLGGSKSKGGRRRKRREERGRVGRGGQGD